MGLQDEITTKLKEAMKAKDEVSLNTLRAIKSALGYKKVESGSPPDDATVLQIIRKEAKMRRESIQQFKNGGRDDLVQREQAELEIIESFLPAEMDEAQLEEKVKQAIEETGASTKSEIGKVMGKVMAELKGQVDGKRVKEIANRLLD